MNQTFMDLALAVDEALQELRDQEQNVKDAEATLAREVAQRVVASARLGKARDELLEAHPELRVVVAGRQVGKSSSLDDWTGPPNGAIGWQPPGEPGAITFVEVDDPDDVPGPR